MELPARMRSQESEESIDGEPDSAAKRYALQRALGQLSRIQNIVPNFQTVKAEMNALIEHYGAEKQDGSDISSPNGPDVIRVGSQEPSHTNKNFDAFAARAASMPAQIFHEVDEGDDEDEGQELVKMAMPASAFLSTIGGKSVGTVMEQKKEELQRAHEEERQRRKEASKLRRMLEANEESPDAVPGLTKQETARVFPEEELDEDKKKHLRALRLAVSRTIKGVRENKSMRWGEPDLFQVKRLIDKIKFGLIHVSEPAGAVPKLVTYICSFGADWDDLVQGVTLDRDSAHIWADQHVWQEDVQISPAVMNMDVPLEWIDPNLLKQWEDIQLKSIEQSKKIDLETEKLQELHEQEKRIRRLRLKQALINASRNGKLKQVLRDTRTAHLASGAAPTGILLRRRSSVGHSADRRRPSSRRRGSESSLGLGPTASVPKGRSDRAKRR